jgi:hypothetical protein
MGKASKFLQIKRGLRATLLMVLEVDREVFIVLTGIFLKGNGLKIGKMVMVFKTTIELERSTKETFRMERKMAKEGLFIALVMCKIRILIVLIDF